MFECSSKPFLHLGICKNNNRPWKHTLEFLDLVLDFIKTLRHYFYVMILAVKTKRQTETRIGVADLD